MYHEFKFGFLKRRRRRARSARGNQIVEVAAGLLLTIIVFVPLLDLTLLGIRLFTAQWAAVSYVRQLALCESFGQSLNMMQSGPSLVAQMQTLLGAKVDTEDLCLRISRTAPPYGECQLVDKPGQIPASWLPDGEKAPCDYALELKVKLLVPPLFRMRNKESGLPGLTKPFPIVIAASHEWENLGRDPATNQYFMNE